MKPQRASLHYRHTNWEDFKDHLEENLQTNMPLKTLHDIESTVEDLTTTTQKAAWPPPQSLNERNVVSYNFPLSIRKKLSEKRRARRVRQQTRLPQDKNNLNTLTKQLQRLIHDWKNESFNEHIRNLSPNKHDYYPLWKATKHLKLPERLFLQSVKRMAPGRAAIPVKLKHSVTPV